MIRFTENDLEEKGYRAQKYYLRDDLSLEDKKI